MRMCSGENPAQLVARLACQKAADVAGRVTGGLILGCDTVAECDGRILGKPRTRHTRGRCFERSGDGAIGC